MYNIIYRKSTEPIILLHLKKKGGGAKEDK